MTEENVTGSLDEVNASVESVNETQQTVRDEEFVATDLTVETGDRRISFADPLLVDG